MRPPQFGRNRLPSAVDARSARRGRARRVALVLGLFLATPILGLAGPVRQPHPAAPIFGVAEEVRLPPLPIVGGGRHHRARFYSDSSFWNSVIPSNAAVDPNSFALVQAALVAYRSGANFADTDTWGIPIVFAHDGDKTYDIGCTDYDCGTKVSFRIPAGAKANKGSDHHLVVIDGTRELDMFNAHRNVVNATWSASARYVTDAYGWGAICSQGNHCNGAVASGFSAFGGIPRPEDFARDVIPHALTITTPRTRSGFIACPATHTDGTTSSTSALPEGARLQLDPSFNVAAQSWPTWMKVIAKTLQVYGAYVSDTGGSLAIRGEADLNRQGAWQAAKIPEGASLTALPWERMRVLRLTRC